jgi:uncharacterized repeat protein (TIGR01451 family)
MYYWYIDDNLAFELTGDYTPVTDDEDSCFVHCVDTCHMDVEKYVWVPEPGNYLFCLEDDWGDGWNGNYVLVYVNGDLVGNVTMTTGAGPDCYYLPVNPGDEITTDYVEAGSWGYENEYYVVDTLGNEVRREGAGGIVPGDILPGELYADPGVWVDADDNESAVDKYISTTVKFLITIHNDGVCDLLDVWAYDYYDDSLEYLDASIPPTINNPGELIWQGLGDLSHCEWINITVWFHVVGPHCSIDENLGAADGLCPCVDPAIYVGDADSAFIHCVEPPIIEIDVEKYVWNGFEWVDADTELDAIDVDISTVVPFLITIHNTGNRNLTNVEVYDFMDDSMEFEDSDHPPISVTPVPNGTVILWFFPGILEPCEWINITVFAHIVGPHCSIDENYVNVTTYFGDIPNPTVVYDNSMHYTGLGASQNDTGDPNFQPFCADDFIFEFDTLVSDVHWIAGYWNGPPDDGNFDWEIKFYEDFGDGSKPGTEIATFVFPKTVVKRTMIEEWDFEHSVVLPTFLNFNAGTKYWISIRGVGAYPPQSGFGLHDDLILNHMGVFQCDYFGFYDWTDTVDVFGYAADFAFQLTAPIPVYDDDSAFVHCVGVGDMFPPEITNKTHLRSDPRDTSLPGDPPGFIGGWEYISAVVTDDTGVNTVQLNLTKPDLTTEIIPMNLVGGDTYACNFTATQPGGIHKPGYNYTVYATDIAGKDTEHPQQSFIMPMNQDVNEDGQVLFSDIMGVAGEWLNTGTPGWIRADVNNDGQVLFSDIMGVAGAWLQTW